MGQWLSNPLSNNLKFSQISVKDSSNNNITSISYSNYGVCSVKITFPIVQLNNDLYNKYIYIPTKKNLEAANNISKDQLKMKSIEPSPTTKSFPIQENQSMINNDEEIKPNAVNHDHHPEISEFEMKQQDLHEQVIKPQGDIDQEKNKLLENIKREALMEILNKMLSYRMTFGNQMNDLSNDYQSIIDKLTKYFEEMFSVEISSLNSRINAASKFQGKIDDERSVNECNCSQSTSASCNESHCYIYESQIPRYTLIDSNIPKCEIPVWKWQDSITENESKEEGTTSSNNLDDQRSISLKSPLFKSAIVSENSAESIAKESDSLNMQIVPSNSSPNVNDRNTFDNYLNSEVEKIETSDDESSEEYTDDSGNIDGEDNEINCDQTSEHSIHSVPAASIASSNSSSNSSSIEQQSDVEEMIPLDPLIKDVENVYQDNIANIIDTSPTGKDPKCKNKNKNNKKAEKL